MVGQGTPSVGVSLAASLSLIRWFSSSQSPRSISRQRSLQNGRQRDVLFQTTFLPQVGQETVVGITGDSKRKT